MRFLDRLLGSGGILAYHGVVDHIVSPNVHVTPSRMREQLEAVRDRYEIIPLAEYLARHGHGRSVSGCLAVTFDDAYVGVARLAAPILAELDVPATLFVVSGSARRGDQFWWDRAEWAFERSPESAWHELLARAHLPPSSGREAWEAFRTRVLTRFAGRFDTHDTDAAIEIDADLRSLRFDELESLARDARVDFAVHTESHACLPFLADADRDREIERCYHELRDRLPRVRPVLAYPYGLFNRGTIASARRCGIEAGVTMDGRAPSRFSGRYTIPRLGVMEDRSARSIDMRLNGATRPLHVFRDRGLHAQLPVDCAPRVAGTR
ncbi:MAG: polysaccharide deacetylase family protein [Gemmatimonadaceae bacterium]